MSFNGARREDPPRTDLRVSSGRREQAARTACPFESLGSNADHLAALSGNPPPDGPVLLAEVEGKPVAAIGIFDRRAVADPGRSTLGVRMQLHLLRLHVRAVASLGWL